MVLSLAKTSPMPPNERASAIVRATRASCVDWAAGLRLNAQTAGVIAPSHQRTSMAPVAPPSGRRRDSLAESGPFRKRNPCLQLTWPAQLAERRARPGRVDLTANRTVNPRSSLKLVPPHQRAPRRPSLRHLALRFLPLLRLLAHTLNFHRKDLTLTKTTHNRSLNFEFPLQGLRFSS